MRTLNRVLSVIAVSVGSSFLVLFLLSFWKPLAFSIPLRDRTYQFASANRQVCVADVRTFGPHRSELPIAVDACETVGGTWGGTTTSIENPDTLDHQPYGVVTTRASGYAISDLPPMILCGGFLFARSVYRTMRARPALAHVCPTCGYDLRATPDRCPECGTEAKATAKTG